MSKTTPPPPPILPHRRRLGELIREARTQHDMTQRQLAVMLDVKQQAVQAWEANTSVPQRERLDELVALFGLDTELGRYIEIMRRFDKDGGYEAVGTPDGVKLATPLQSLGLINRARLTQSLSRAVRPQTPYEVFAEEFRKALPEKFRENCDKTVTLGPRTMRFEYLSANVAASIVRFPYELRYLTHQRAAPALVRLSVLRAISTETYRARKYALFMLTENLPRMGLEVHNRSLTFEANVLGIDAYFPPTVSNVADVIDALEFLAMNPDLPIPDDDDDAPPGED